MLKLKSVLVLIVISITLTSCFKYEEVVMKEVTNVSVNSFSANNIEIKVDMRIINPNNYKISIVDSDLELFVKNKKVGNSKIKDKIDLPKNSDETHQIVVKTTVEDMIGTAIPVILSVLFEDSVDLQVKGEIKAQAKSLSKSFPVDFKERVRLDK
ncbi:MAG: LEA type 2 family protein [Flavobacteriales bacterium]|nr:LEA type 2 family protein [Flavobacteriales bacterium]